MLTLQQHYYERNQRRRLEVVSGWFVEVVNGQWSEWSKWGDCSEKCGKGTQRRMRRCNNPEPQRGGNDCPGTDAQSRDCVCDATFIASGITPIDCEQSAAFRKKTIDVSIRNCMSTLNPRRSLGLMMIVVRLCS